LFLTIKLDVVVGFGAFGKVFKVTNIKTKEIKVLKAVIIMDNLRSGNSEEFKIVHYNKIFDDSYMFRYIL
jgi:hypothetical protein